MKTSIIPFLLMSLFAMQCVAQTAGGDPGIPVDVLIGESGAADGGDQGSDDRSSRLGPDEEPPAAAGIDDPGTDDATTTGAGIADGPLVEDDALFDTREQAHIRFLRLSDEQRYDEALVAAGEVVALTTKAFGPGALELATPVANLATTQMRVGDYDSAEANYKRCIKIIETQESRLSPRLINPLIGLGSGYNQTGLYDSAVIAYERALRINNVNEGFYSFDQFKIRDGLTESNLGIREMEEANFQQEAQLEVYQRKFGQDDPATVPGIYKLAEWYTRTGQIEAAMQTYRRADGILRKTPAGKANPQRVGALEGMAQVYESVGNQSASASALKSALTVIDAQTEVDYPARAGVLVKLGDLYVRGGKASLAEQHYAEAWRDLSREDEWLSLRDEYFDEPVRISGRPLSSLRYAPGATDKARQQLEEGYALLTYSVGANGKVSDSRIVEGDPPGVMDNALVSAFARSVFRPRRVDNQPTDSDGRLYQLDFLFAPAPGATGKGDDAGQLEYPDGKLADDEPPASEGRIDYPARESD